MSERMIERDEFGREIVYVSGKDIPSRPQWNKHINNCVEEGNMEKAMNAARDMMNLGVEPNVITFNTLIKGWCKVGKMPVAMHVTKVMLKMGIYPSEITYRTLIRLIDPFKDSPKDTSPLSSRKIGRGMGRQSFATF